MADKKKPTVSSFFINGFCGLKGNGVQVSYKVQDDGGSGLSKVELWRKGNGSDWKEVAQNSASGKSALGSFSDVPSSAGTYKYEIRVKDKAGNKGESSSKEWMIAGPAPVTAGYVYKDAKSLAGKPPADNQQCVRLIQIYAKAPLASTWNEGQRVKGSVLPIGTAIATFVNGKYPNKDSGNHAAFYISQDANGVWVIDQWYGCGTIRYRQLRFKGQNKDGTFVDPVNNGHAFSVVR